VKRITIISESLICMRTMRAILIKEFGDASVCKLVKDVPIPEIQPKELLIRVHAAGVNPVDTYIRSGTYSRRPNLPYVPGLDSGGVVEKVGSDVHDFKAGDRVFTVNTITGTYADYCVARSDFTFHLPSNVTYEQGSALGVPYFTAYRALIIKGNSKPNETVLIHAACGGVGLASVQLAKAMGMKVIGTASTEEGMKTVKEQGADLVFNHKQDGYLKDIMNSTQNGEGVDIILEMVANVNLNNDLQLLKPKCGRVVVIGNRGTIDFNPRLLMAKETSICGVTLFSSTEDDFGMINAYLQHGIQHGYLKPVLGKTYLLEEAAQAQTDVMQNSGTCGRLTLKLQ